MQAYNAAEGRDFWEKGHVDMALLDVNLPDGNGYELLETIRKTSQIPVLLITANDLESDEITGFSLGADDYITKPFSLMALRARVERMRMRTGEGQRETKDTYTDHRYRFLFDQMQFFVDGQEIILRAVISGDADIALMGPEATIYQYNEGNENYLINFAQLTQRAGNFVVSRTKEDDFQWEDLKGKEVIGGRPGGMPEMVFEYVLKKHNIDPHKDVNLVQNIDFANTSGAFVGGTGDYTVEFEPSATMIEEEGAGYVVASVGTESGYVPYTAYSTTKEFLAKNKELLQSFTKAIEKGQKYVEEHTAAEVAEVIAPQFKETDEKTIEKPPVIRSVLSSNADICFFLHCV